MLLHVQEQVARARSAVEVAQRSHLSGGVVRGEGEDARSRLPDLQAGELLARRRDMAPRQLRVETELHEAARLEQRQQHAPPGHRLAHVVQHAGALDEVEALPERAEPQDVGLGEAQVGEPELGAAPHRVSEARAADVHGEHPAVGLELRGDGDMPPGTAAGDEYPRRVGRRELRRVGVREKRAQHAPERERRPARGALPARIRVGFVLRLHAA